MQIKDKKRLSIFVLLLTTILSIFVYFVIKNFDDKLIEIEPEAPNKQSIEAGLLTKKVKNPNILEGYYTLDINQLNLSSLEQPGEKALVDDDYYKISSEDSQNFSANSPDKSVFQRYKLKIEKDLTNQATFPVKWQGKSNKTVDIYGWDYTLNSWVLLNYNIGRSGEDLTITADLDAKTMVKDIVANLLVGTAGKNTILKGRTPDKSEYDFTFAWLSDTQYYSASYPEIYNDITNHIVEKQKEEKIVYGIHTGDLVDNMDDLNQWKNADLSMKILDKAGFPYGVLAGNHDVGHTAFNYTEYYKYFGESRFKDKSSYGASPNNNRDHYDLISAGGKDFIILYLGWGQDEKTFAWANETLKKYSDRTAIVAAHGYISGRGTYVETGKAIFENIITQNKNIKLILSGHYGGAAINIKRNGEHVFYEMMANYQFNAEGGAGYFRMLHFDAKNNLIYVNTYSPYKKDFNFYDDYKEEFIIPLNDEAGENILKTDNLVF